MKEVPCTYCGTIVERLYKRQIVCCFNCKMHMMKLRAESQIERNRLKSKRTYCISCRKSLPKWKRKYCSDLCARERFKSNKKVGRPVKAS